MTDATSCAEILDEPLRRSIRRHHLFAVGVNDHEPRHAPAVLSPAV